MRQQDGPFLTLSFCFLPCFLSFKFFHYYLHSSFRLYYLMAVTYKIISTSISYTLILMFFLCLCRVLLAYIGLCLLLGITMHIMQTECCCISLLRSFYTPLISLSLGRSIQILYLVKVVILQFKSTPQQVIHLSKFPLNTVEITELLTTKCT